MGPKSITLALTATWFRPADGGGDVPPCFQCAEQVEVHQPEPEGPDRLLGTCPGCGAWYLLDALADRSEVAMVLLPGGVELHPSLAEVEGDGA